MTAAPKHFLDLDRFQPQELRHLLELGKACKAGTAGRDRPLEGKAVALVFEKPTARTRVSFEVGIRQLGAEPVVLEPQGTQLGRGETVGDTARVLSRYVDAIMLRTTKEEKLLELAENASVPVINGLTDHNHPCQLLADLQTFIEHRGDIQGRTVAWIGDGNNMCNSYIDAAMQFDFQLRIACPPGFLPEQTLLQQAGDRVQVIHDPLAAAQGADLVVTDVWASMGQEDEQARRREAFRDYCVTAEIMAAAAPDALFMHCLPAHRGEEVAAEVIDGPQSVVWDEAENRLHAQKALLEFLLLGPT